MSAPSVIVEPWQPRLAEEAVVDLFARLGRSRRSALAAESWELGVPESWLTDLLEDWLSYDVAEFQARLDQLEHCSADVDGQQLHVVQAVGNGSDPLPLLLTHGWPSSFCEYLDLLPLLTDPAGHGANPADAFTVVVPSLPGFGFSASPPSGGLTGRAVAKLWHKLMTDGLGHRRYVAHGSDLGVGVTSWLARDNPDAVAGIHLATPGLAPPPQPWAAAETAYFTEVDAWRAEEGGYAHEHSTKPASLAAALLDSPIGLAAWVGEKITAWSSTPSNGRTASPRRFLLDTLTLYWATGTIGSSLLPYWANRHSRDAALPAGTPPQVPTAISLFGGERVPFAKPPRHLASRYFTISHWSEHDRGGHFPAVAEPHLLAGVLREVFRPSRADTERQ
jgi:pimeloyl-ACP methyl ester carboxylesterase